MKFLPIALATICAGCATVTAVDVNDPRISGPVRGIRYYAPKPILIIERGVSRIEYIPNADKEYAIQFTAFLAKNNSKFTLNSNGTLLSLETDLDSTDALETINAAIEKLGLVAKSNNLAALTEGGGGGASINIQIFDFVFNGEGDIVRMNMLYP